MRTMVVIAAGGFSTKMSDQVTDKLEEKLRDLPGVDYTKSFHRWQQIRLFYINLKGFAIRNKIRPTWEEAEHDQRRMDAHYH